MNRCSGIPEGSADDSSAQDAQGLTRFWADHGLYAELCESVGVDPAVDGPLEIYRLELERLLGNSAVTAGVGIVPPELQRLIPERAPQCDVVVMREGLVERVGTPEEVYEDPATPFVYHFLGHVNVFHGHVAEGMLDVGAFTLGLPLQGLPEATAAVAYVRPHLLDIHHQPTEPPEFRAMIDYIAAAGPLVKIELATETGTAVHAEVSQERYRQLGLQRGDAVFVRVKDFRLFPQHHHGVGGSLHHAYGSSR